jgi:hypothetical protein
MGFDGLDDYGIRCKEKGKDVHYFIKWSPLSKADRWSIIAKVPSVAGVYEVYWMDDHVHLRMLYVGQTHYGGLRSELRRLTDPELNKDLNAKKTLEDQEIWFRYAPCNSAAMMADVIWFFRKTYFPEEPGVDHSGRYEKLFMNESAPDKLIWVP